MAKQTCAPIRKNASGFKKPNHIKSPTLRIPWKNVARNCPAKRLTTANPTRIPLAKNEPITSGWTAGGFATRLGTAAVSAIAPAYKITAKRICLRISVFRRACSGPWGSGEGAGGTFLSSSLQKAHAADSSLFENEHFGQIFKRVGARGG